MLLEVTAVRVCQSDQVEGRERLQFETHHNMRPCGPCVVLMHAAVDH